MKQIGTGDTFAGLVRDLAILSLEAYRWQYTELTRRVVAEGKDITPEIMHAMLLCAHNDPNNNKPKT